MDTQQRSNLGIKDELSYLQYSPGDPEVDPGDEPNTAHIPYEPPSSPTPVIRAPEGTDRPWDDSPQRPDPEHAPENEPPDADPGDEESPEAP